MGHVNENGQSTRRMNTLYDKVVDCMPVTPTEALLRGHLDELRQAVAKEQKGWGQKLGFQKLPNGTNHDNCREVPIMHSL